MDFDSFKEQCIRIDEKMSAAQIEKKRRDIGPRSNSAPVSTYPSPITPAVRPPFSAPTIPPSRFPIGICQLRPLGLHQSYREIHRSIGKSRGEGSPRRRSSGGVMSY